MPTGSVNELVTRARIYERGAGESRDGSVVDGMVVGSTMPDVAVSIDLLLGTDATLGSR